MFQNNDIPSDGSDTPCRPERIVHTDAAIQTVALVTECDGENKALERPGRERTQRQNQESWQFTTAGRHKVVRESRACAIKEI